MEDKLWFCEATAYITLGSFSGKAVQVPEPRLAQQCAPWAPDWHGSAHLMLEMSQITTVASGLGVQTLPGCYPYTQHSQQCSVLPEETANPHQHIPPNPNAPYPRLAALRQAPDEPERLLRWCQGGDVAGGMVVVTKCS